jgi:hypothetical protein
MFYLKGFVSVSLEQAANLHNNTITSSNQMDRLRCSNDDEDKNEAFPFKKTMFDL